MIGSNIFITNKFSFGNLITKLIKEFKTRVLADGGTFEAEQCLKDSLPALIENEPSLLVTPNAVEVGKLFPIIPTNGAGDLNVVRATSATRVDEQGLIEIPRTNLLLRSEEFDNATWTKINSTITANATTSPSGTMTADKLVENNTNSPHYTLQSTSPLVIGNTYFVSIYLKAAERNRGKVRITGASTIETEFNLQNGTVSLANAIIQNMGNGWYRIGFSFVANDTTMSTVITLSNSTTGNSGFNYTYLGDNTSGLFLRGAQLEVGNVATEYIPTTSVIRTRFAGITQDGGSASNIPRIDYTNGSCPSILVEPQRTNSIRNSSMVGAVVGSPGTLPTNWLRDNTLNQTIVSKGVENGLDYIDYKLSGTASSVNSQLQFEGTNIINASNSQTWAFSLYAKIISASNPPLNYQIRFREATATGTFVADGIQKISITNSFQRFSFVRTNTGTTTERIQPMLLFGTTVGQVYDFTVRIYAPQMELGSNATSYIPTTTTAVTRNADVISKSGISDLIGQTEGTIYYNLSVNSINNASKYIILNDGTTNNRIIIGHDTGGSEFRLYYTSSGITSFTYTGSSWATGVVKKIAIVYATNNFKLFIDGVLVYANNSVTTFNLNNLTIFQITATVDFKINTIGLWKTALTNTQAIQLTTL